jgi:hypothetical protein
VDARLKAGHGVIEEARNDTSGAAKAPVRAAYSDPGYAFSLLAAEARRQSLAVTNSPHENEDQDFIDAVSALNAG